MVHSRSSSGQSSQETGFPEQFVGTTHRHPESRVLRGPWEPKEVDMVRRARKLSMMRHQVLQARQFGIEEEDEDDDLDSPRSPMSSRKRTAFPGMRNSNTFLRPTATLALPPGAAGHPLHRPVSHEGSASPTGSSYIGEELGRPITAETGRPRGGMDGHVLAATRSAGPRMHSHSQSQSSTESYDDHLTWTPNPHAILGPAERGGWGALAAKFGEWRRRRSRSNSFGMK